MIRRANLHPPGVFARVENGQLLYAPVIVAADASHTHVYLSGQLARDSEGVIRSQDMRDQIRATCENIGKCLDYVGATFDDVVSTITHVVDLKEYFPASDERFKFFRENRPASTLVQVAALAAPDARIEITAEAIIETARLRVEIG